MGTIRKLIAWAVITGVVMGFCYCVWAMGQSMFLLCLLAAVAVLWALSEITDG